MKVKEESEKAGLKLNIQKMKIMAFGPIQFISVQFSRSVVSNSLQPHESQHACLPCPSTNEWVKKMCYNIYNRIFSSLAQSCLILCNPMNRSTPGLPVHHQLPEFTQTHVHRLRDAIQPSHPLSSPSPPAPNPSQHHSLFQ